MTPVAVLVGPPGAGTSTVARIIGHRLGLPVRDTDADVENAAGKAVADIFVDDGEPAFRALERSAVRAALAEHDGVVSVGGGAVMDVPTATALAAARPVVFLDVQITDAAKRIGFNRDRPAGVGNPRAQWLRMMEVRRPVYERLATVTVVTDGRTPEEVASEVIEALQLRVRRPEGRTP